MLTLNTEKSDSVFFFLTFLESKKAGYLVSSRSRFLQIMVLSQFLFNIPFAQHFQ